MKKLLILDGSSLLSIGYYGSVPFSNKGENIDFSKIRQKDGIYLNGIYYFMKHFIETINIMQPSHVAVCWDVTRDTFRRKIYEPYKDNRDEAPKPLIQQFATMQSILDKIGVKQFYSTEYEADDYLGSLSEKFKNEIEVALWTKDRDCFQLIDKNVALLLISKKADEIFLKYGLNKNKYKLPKEVFPFTPYYFEKEYGYKPNLTIDIKGLIGDKGDNIPGVKGVGEKTVIPLINKYKNIETLYSVIENLNSNEEDILVKEWKSKFKIKQSPIKKLLSSKEEAFLSKKLATIVKDIPIKESLDDLKTNINIQEFNNICSNYEFKNLIN